MLALPPMDGADALQRVVYPPARFAFGSGHRRAKDRAVHTVGVAEATFAPKGRGHVSHAVVITCVSAQGGRGHAVVARVG